ncbi:MAG: hypothetical protein P4L46_11605 [Fimbriimonas sp.]|nr:hypothetical protein [Fimbriimonas sp.]
MKRVITVSAMAACAVLAYAVASFSNVFVKTYNVDANSPLGKASCSVCHVGKHGGKLNPYGKDMQSTMKAEHSHKLTAEILHKLDNIDSTKTGKKNIEKIKAGLNPGVD